MEPVRHPNHRDPNSGRKCTRCFHRNGPEAWLRVVTEFSGDHDRIVTAFPQSNDPTESR
jgi:hypothetical protein